MNALRKISRSRMTKRLEAIEQRQELLLRAIDTALAKIEERLEKLEKRRSKK